MKIYWKRHGWRLLCSSKLYRYLPHGFDQFFDISRKSCREFKVVFDVGANVGQSIYRMRHSFPHAEIYCFEPVLSTFNELRENTKNMRQVQCFQLALGSSRGTGQITLSSSLTNSLMRKIEADSKVETVRIDTLDQFCNEHNVRQIDFLKVDTEGFDLEVLKGANRMLTHKQIAFIQVEAGTSYTNNEHAPLQEFRQYLEEKEYDLFGIYEQILEYSGEARLMFCDAVFISREAEVNSKHHA